MHRISADDHMDMNWLPKDLWSSRLPAHLVERGPKVVEIDGKPNWVCDGAEWVHWGPGMVSKLFGIDRKASTVLDGEQSDGQRFRPSDPALRLEDLDRDGTAATVIYSLPFQLALEDAELDAAIVKVYNDWLAEFARFAPDRLIPLAMLPWWDTDAAVREVEHAAEIGLRGVMFEPFKSTEPVWHEMWDPVWAAAADHDLPLHFHQGGVRHTRSVEAVLERGQRLAWASLTILGTDEIIASMLACGALDRNPNLRVVFAETGVGWVSWLIERMGSVARRAPDHLVAGDPAEAFHRQCYVTFTAEEIGIHTIEPLGAEKVMWASDYPHNASTWPNSQAYIDEHVGSVLGAEALSKVLYENAAQLYKISPQPVTSG